MTEIEFVELLREYGGDKSEPGTLAWLAEFVDWVAAVGDEDARAALSEAQADNLRASKKGVNTIADAIEQKAPSS